MKPHARFFYNRRMAILHILQYPDPRLRHKALVVDKVDDSVQQLINDMFETMYDDHGIGLAATQVNVQKRIITLDLSNNQSAPQCFINPKIMSTRGTIKSDEGCLSFPGVYEKIDRAAEVTVQYLDRDGKAQEICADELLAQCLQHEHDHLDGILFIDHLSALRQSRMRKKLEKVRRRAL